MERLPPEKRLRAVPAHLVPVLLSGGQAENPFDQKLADAVKASFHPGKVSGPGDGEEFFASLKHKQVTYEGACRLIEVSELY